MSKLGIVKSSLSNVVDSINAEMEDSLTALNDNAQRRAASEHANIDAAKSLTKINSEVQTIENKLSTEREERKSADEENMRYTQKMDKINLTVAIISGIFGIIGTVLGIVSFFK